MSRVSLKVLLIIPVLLLLTCFCFGQAKDTDSAYCSITIPYRPATIYLAADTGIVHSYSSRWNGRIISSNIPAGRYKFFVDGPGKSRDLMDSVVVMDGQKLVLRYQYDGPCLYDYPAGYIPTCPKKHTDSIIAIVYGLVVSNGDRYIKDKKKMKTKYAGCVTTGCAPQYYCKQHDIEF